MRFGMFIRKYAFRRKDDIVFNLTKVSRITVFVGDLITIIDRQYGKDEFICKTQRKNNSFKCIQIFKDMEMRLNVVLDRILLSMGSMDSGENIVFNLLDIKKLLIETQYGVCDGIDNMEKIIEEIRYV